ncbi:30S ribosomal protein S4 [Candidatus Marsarchaeota archaeon]|jgi:small subunit ribosomal protein S4|nr:30S ribosomal protein S4 [Candidatus Marsarchaeota archaeon]
MGAPKRNRAKHNRPKEVWSTERITSDNQLLEEYGLKNMKELWIAQTRTERIRRNARLFLSGASSTNKEEVSMIARLSKYGITKQDATLDNLLDLNERALLERRLQSVVFRKGLARTMKQARQFITHGFISVNGKRVNRPGYLVSLSDEKFIGYYKPIKIEPVAQSASEPQPAAQQEETQST